MDHETWSERFVVRDAEGGDDETWIRILRTRWDGHAGRDSPAAGCEKGFSYQRILAPADQRRFSHKRPRDRLGRSVATHALAPGALIGPSLAHRARTVLRCGVGSRCTAGSKLLGASSLPGVSHRRGLAHAALQQLCPNSESRIVRSPRPTEPSPSRSSGPVAAAPKCESNCERSPRPIEPS